MANLVYNDFKGKIMDGTHDLDTQTTKVMLVTSTYVPDADAHHFRSDVTNEVSGGGYTAGGQALVSPSITVDDATDKAYLDANNVVWSSSTITARGAVLYKDTGNAATDNLIGYVDFGADYSSSNGDFTINWAAGGILELT